jgi:hypothetical protein
MDSTIALLKEEINKTNEEEHDLAKWKLGVTAALGAAALGLGTTGSPPYWLLLFIPLVCAYIDLFEYQYELRIRVIARFLRRHGHENAILLAYEKECETVRQNSEVFSLGEWAQLLSSLGASLVVAPVFLALNRLHHATKDILQVPLSLAVVIWVMGVVVVVGLRIYFEMMSRQLADDPAGALTQVFPRTHLNEAAGTANATHA